mmetsp:Transcript_19403/g.40158  ORF Transcript_19403/g.40158 Transcript_19403/m.40158 type:complete len:309 (-) Transcript_19403:3-929(-)
MKMKKREIFWLLMDAFSGLADQASDMLMLYEYHSAGDMDFFGVGLAGPQTLLQSFVALRRPEGLNKYVLYASICLSLFSISKTLVTSIIMGGPNKDKFNHYPTKVRMFILSLTYVLCEMVSRVFSIALLGYFSGGYFIAGYGSGEILFTWVLIWLLGGDPVGALVGAFFLPITSLGCSEKFNFKVFLCLRLFILALYAATPHVTKYDDVEFIEPTDDDIPAIFFGLMAIATTIWVLIMPAFVNSLNNLDIKLMRSYKPDRFTSWYYPLDVKKYEGKGDDSSAKGCCSCIYDPKAGQVDEEVVDVATMV